MTGAGLDPVVRAAGGRIVAALAARFRSLDLAEEAFADACLAAAETWGREGAPEDGAAWLYRVALRRALDRLRRRRIRTERAPDPPPPEPTPEDLMIDDARLIPDERLRLIFVCCHPAVAIESRAALTLKLVCGLGLAEIARAFLVGEFALAQRLTRAKRKIAEAGIPFAVPGPEAWGERLEAVLSTLEVAYAKAHEDAAGAGPHAGYGPEMLGLTRTLAGMLPQEAGVLALAAIVRYAEARRPARLDEGGAMVPLAEQDPGLWDRARIFEADGFRAAAEGLDPTAPRTLQARLHAAWCARQSLAEPPPWPRVLALYEALLRGRDDPIVRLNRAVALAEVEGPAAALAEIEALPADRMREFLPFHATRADLLRRLGRADEAREAYDAALAQDPGPAERIFLTRRRDGMPDSPDS